MITELKDGYVKSEIHNGIATIEFFHPQSNSLPGKLLQELVTAIYATGNDTSARVIILRSGGEKAFCAGASFDELVAIKNEQEGLQFFSGFAHVINALRKCSQLIIGRIQGKCVGGGVGIAAAVDYAIATESADIKLSELAIGIGPFVVGPVIERKIGVSAFMQLTIDAAMWRNADWAKRKGLFAEVHSTTENMDEAIKRLALTLSHSSSDAMKEIKNIFWRGTENWDELLIQRAAISGKLALSDFTKNEIKKLNAAKTSKKN